MVLQRCFFEQNCRIQLVFGFLSNYDGDVYIKTIL
uniref:Uncharacterized protein n=1 Tax=Arundo donax TaxID=35708 RepID=A0A0A9B4G3_ARUDO